MAGSIAELSKYRYERALEELKNAKEVLMTGSYKLALNRSYYAIFHAMRAVNVLDEFDSSKHSGVIAHFNQYHVKQVILKKMLPRLCRMLWKCVNMQIMMTSLWLQKKDAEEQISKAELFLGYVKSFLMKKGITFD